MPAATSLLDPVGDPESIRTLTWEAGRRSDDTAAIVAAAIAVIVPTLPPGQQPIVESVDHPGPGAAVVTIMLLDDGRIGERVAVPVVISALGVAATGGHWNLPVEHNPLRGLPVEPVDDPKMLQEVKAALAAAGLAAMAIEGVSVATDSWPIVAHVRDGDGASADIWLRRVAKQLVVAGTTAASTQDDQ